MCASDEPEIQRIDDDHFVACHFPNLEPVGQPVTVGGEANT